MPEVSIVITTYRRAFYLQKTLTALAAQTIALSRFEVIVVDNNSQDTTKDVALTFSEVHPDLRLRYVLETQQGTSFARNRGVIEAQAQIVAFTEDDAMPCPDWLERLLEVFSDVDVSCAGGPIELDYQGQEQPEFFRGDLQGLLGGFHLPYTQITAAKTWTEFPWGGNMAFRKRVFDEVGLFTTELGPSADIRLTAEETEFINRIYESGNKILYVPAARVKHLVLPERLNKAHIFHVSRGLASSHVILTSDPRPHMVLRWFASDLWYTLRMLGKLCISLGKRNPLWYDDYIRFWTVAKRIDFRLKAILKGYRFTYKSKDSKSGIAE